ncbi:hypothetical protein [Streptomyces sp. NPDC059753]|uniref:hypothetical protein n=1 Tax=Streptomyces sp. NPDC059753 TaxID=3346933 RepID=UPI003667BC70
MSKVYERTENGTTAIVGRSEGLDEINHAMMAGKRDVRTMSSITRTDFAIEYKDGRSVRLVLVDEPAEVTEEPTFDEHVISYNGGKVHTAMPAIGGNAYPLCRGGGQNQHLTKFRPTTAPLSCKTCMGYAEGRTVAARKAEKGN